MLLSFLRRSAGRKAAKHAYTDMYAPGVYSDAHGNRMPYRLLAPAAKSPGERLPLVVFLHGARERGSDNIKQLKNGGAFFADPVNRLRFPAYVLFPQCPARAWTTAINRHMFMEGAPVPPMTQTESTLMCLIDDIALRYPVDPDRIYLVGLSMGGVAVYDLVCRFPRRFAAAVPMCGAVNADRLRRANDVAFMIFHGARDRRVPVVCGRKASRALRRAGADVHYVEFARKGHNCWDAAFAYPPLLPWLFSRRRTVKIPAPDLTPALAEM